MEKSEYWNFRKKNGFRKSLENMLEMWRYWVFREILFLGARFNENCMPGKNPVHEIWTVKDKDEKYIFSSSGGPIVSKVSSQYQNYESIL